MANLELTKKYLPYSEYVNDKLVEEIAIPTDWRVEKLAGLGKVVKERGYGGELLSVYLDRGVIRANEGSLGTHAPSEDLSKYQRVKKGDFVLNNQQAWRGSVGVSELEGIISPAYIIFRFNSEVVPRYYNYLCRSPLIIDQFRLLSKGVGNIQRQIHSSALKHTRAIVPPKDIQSKIASFLDEKTAAIDAVIEKKREQIKLWKEMRSGVINKLIIKGLGNDKLIPSGDLVIGDIPVGWKTEKIKYVVSEPLKYGINTTEAPGVNPDDVRYIRITDVEEDGSLRDDDVKTLPFETAYKHILKDGDLLFARTGATVGKSMLYREEMGRACFAGYLVQVRVRKEKMLPEYLFLLTKSSFYEAWKSSIFIQATIQNISAEKYANLIVPVPPLEEQKKIIDAIKPQMDFFAKAIKEVEKSLDLLTELKTSLISHAVTGKIKI